MKQQQAGFTLIELVVVIVILGILAAVAVPRYADLTDDAEQAVADGIFGAMSSTAVVLLAENEGAAQPIADIISNTTLTSGNTITAPACNDITINVNGTDYTADGNSTTYTLPSEICT